MSSPATRARAAVASGDDQALARLLFEPLSERDAAGVVDALLEHPHEGVRTLLLREATVAAPTVVAAVVQHLDRLGRETLVAAARALAERRDRPGLVAPYARALASWQHPDAEELLLALLDWPAARSQALLEALSAVGSAASIRPLLGLGSWAEPALSAIRARLPESSAGTLSLPYDLGGVQLADEET